MHTVSGMGLGQYDPAWSGFKPASITQNTLRLEPAPNGGWAVYGVQTGQASIQPDVIGYYSTTGDMLEALERLLTPPKTHAVFMGDEGLRPATAEDYARMGVCP